MKSLNFSTRRGRISLGLLIATFLLLALVVLPANHTKREEIFQES